MKTTANKKKETPSATNAALHQRRLKALPRGIVSATSIYVDQAEGTILRDVEGKEYIDFASGIAVLNTGHRHPYIMKKVDEQLNRFTHTAFQVVAYEEYIALAERLNALAPMRNVKTLLMTTGAEAVENAVKIARSYTKRPGIISFVGGFHGRTALTMGLTGKVAPYKQLFGAAPPAIYHAPFPIPHHGISEEDALHGLQMIFKADIAAEDVAAIIIEPVQGEGGFNITPPTFMKKVRAICDQHGIVLICDEIQTGFARTGKLFAIEHYDIEPDMITIAKSLAGGFPLSGVIGRQEIMDAPAPGGLGGTYGGNPVACAAAHGVLDVIEADNLCARSLHIGKTIQVRLAKIRTRPKSLPIGDIRGLGAMTAFELVKEKGGHRPAPEHIPVLLNNALQRGLILLSCGLFGNTIRLLPPLIISDAELADALDILEQSLCA